MATYSLNYRSLIKVSGEEASGFLQSIITNDIFKLEKEALVYACLLTPQGRFLHDFFISKDTETNSYYLECERACSEDLIRRLMIYKMRSKVLIEDFSDQFDVYITDDPEKGNKDPRHQDLGYRFYLPSDKKISEDHLSSIQEYHDLRISLVIPEAGFEIKPEIDLLTDINFDFLNAISWDKGCYIGQEITARMKNRDLIKKRMVILLGENLDENLSLLDEGGHLFGDLRSISSDKTKALVILKNLKEEFFLRKEKASIIFPEYMAEII